jgi:glutamate carboxypeptidase
MLEARGQSAHVGREFEKGVSAVTALARALLRVAEIPDLPRGLIANVGPIEGNGATNAVPDRARAWGNVRFPTNELAAELAASLDSLATVGDALPRIIVHRDFNRPAKPMTPEVERLALHARSAAEDLGQSLPFTKTGGVCDGNILQHEGLATIDTLGVRGGGLHTRDEWIELASLVERCQLLALLMARVSAGG